MKEGKRMKLNKLMQNLNSNLFGTFTCMILLLSGNMLLFNYILANLKKKKK